ncbi:hypothetical protein POUND7_017651 [Theobroma cacao]
MPAGRNSDGRLTIDFIGGVFMDLMPKEEYFSKALYTLDIGQNDLGAGFSADAAVASATATTVVTTSSPQWLCNPSFTNDFSFINDVISSFPCALNVEEEDEDEGEEEKQQQQQKNYHSYELLEEEEEDEEDFDSDGKNLGARSFWIHNTGPIGYLPYILVNLPSNAAAQMDNAGCAKSHNNVAHYFNQKLKQAVVQLRNNLPLAAITCVDVYSVKYSPFSHPKKHGFEHPLVACCGYGGKYNNSSSVSCGGFAVNGTQLPVGSCDRPSVRVNWDGIHYTEAANKFVFDQISTGAFSNPQLPLKMACHQASKE